MNTFMRLALAAGLTTAISAGTASAAIYADKIDWSGSAAAGFDGGAGEWDATAQTFTPATRSNPGDALGEPDQVNNDNGGFLSLGIGGVAVFGFAQAFGTEATVFEVTFRCDGPQTGDLCNYQETADVYAFNGDYDPRAGSFDESDLMGLGFTKVGSIPNGLANLPDGASIAIGGPFTYLALVDTTTRSGDGFDVDSISVSPVPVPAALSLAVFGLGALGFVSRRQRRRA